MQSLPAQYYDVAVMCYFGGEGTSLNQNIKNNMSYLGVVLIPPLQNCKVSLCRILVILLVGLGYDLMF